jgi:hypothetical protein
MSEQKDENSMVKHPNHYNVYDVEVLDMMAAIWGNEAVALWCKMTAFKYRMRMGYKVGVDPSTDFKKEQECLELMHKYKAKSAIDKPCCDPVNKLFESDNVSHTKVEEFDSSYPTEGAAQYNPY